MAWYTIAASNRSYHDYGHQSMPIIVVAAYELWCELLNWGTVLPACVAAACCSSCSVCCTRATLPLVRALGGNYAKLRYRSQYIRELNGIRVRVVCYVRVYMGREEATLSCSASR